MQIPSDQKLGLGILRTNTGHHPASGCPVYYISHGYDATTFLELLSFLPASSRM